MNNERVSVKAPGPSLKFIKAVFNVPECPYANPGNAPFPEGVIASESSRLSRTRKNIDFQPYTPKMLKSISYRRFA